MPASNDDSLRSPRILTFLHSFEPGGVERIALRLVQQWRRSGADATLFMGRREGKMIEQFGMAETMDHAPATRLPVRHFETLWMIFHLHGYIRRNRPDILFAPGNSYAIVAVMMKLLLGRRCPPVVLKISNDLARPDMGIWQIFYRLWVKMQGRFIDRFIAMTEPLARQIAQETGIQRHRIAIVANPSLPAEPALMREIPHNSEGRSFCAVGRLTRQKNLPLLLRAFASARQDGDELVLYGEGPEQHALCRLASELGIADILRLAGHVPDIRPLLDRHHVLLLASHYEGMPSAIIEALEAGLHIVATDCCCSMAALLDGGATGTLVPPGNQDALAQAIAAAPQGQRDTARATEMANRHRIDRCAPMFLDLFKCTYVEASKHIWRMSKGSRRPPVIGMEQSS